MADTKPQFADLLYQALETELGVATKCCDDASRRLADDDRLQLHYLPPARVQAALLASLASPYPRRDFPRR